MTTTPHPWRLRRLNDYAHVVQFAPDEPLPAWAAEPAEFVSITRNEVETSIITTHPEAAKADGVAGPYACFCVDEQLDFVLTGVMATLLVPLEELHISTLALSTYTTDWLLVPSEEADDATEAWRARGHTVTT